MAHFLDHRGDRAVGQVLGQDGAVDGREGLLARKAHGKHTEVALSGQTRWSGGGGGQLEAGQSDPILPMSHIWGAAGVNGFPLFTKTALGPKGV